MIAKDKSQQFDWDEIKRRLARAEESLAAFDHLTPEQAKAVMDERAETLAKVPDQAPDTSQILEVLTFRLGSERFAIETRFVREVVPPGEITPLPGGPDFLIGLTNLRGEVLAIVDLRTFFGLPASQHDQEGQAVIMGEQRVEFGLLADAVDEVLPLRIDLVLDSAGSVSVGNRELLRGVTADALLVIDGEALLADERLNIDQSDKG